MAAETPVLERRPSEKLRMPFGAYQSYEDCFNEEEVHNARIRDTYARLINPDSKIEDVFSAEYEEESEVRQPEEIKAEAPAAPARPYLVENARADSILFRADHPINRVSEPEVMSHADDDSEEENEDLRPTSTTIQYQTIGKAEAKSEIKASAAKKAHILGKREIIIIAVVVTVIVALLTLIIVNSSIIAGLNADIAVVENDITAVRGALAGVNTSIADLVPESVRDLLIK